jgi:hypothetical protein
MAIKTTLCLTVNRYDCIQLEKERVPNQLLTVKNGGHGQFPLADFVKSYQAIWAFLRQNRIIN